MWASKYVKYCNEPLRYFYNCYAKILRYNSYVLKNVVAKFGDSGEKVEAYIVPAIFFIDKFILP